MQHARTTGFFVTLTAATAVLLGLSGMAQTPAPQTAPKPDSSALERLRRTPSHVILADGTIAGTGYELAVERSWDGPWCHSTLVNHGTKPVAIKEIVLFDLPLDLPPETTLYGESFQMLSQTAGTLGKPVDLGYSEKQHYKIPQPADVSVATGLLTLTPPNGDTQLFAFTSSKKFVGRFYVTATSLKIVIDTEGLTISPREGWDFEEFTFATGSNREALLAALADRIDRNHPPLKRSTPPTGWCSWYAYGAKVTAADVLANLDVIAKDVPSLKYVQVDDGYQPAMGDWLDTGPAFGGDVRGVLQEIRKRGFEPAIWVAPFIAEADSKLFQQHPDWFIADADGKPLPSDRVTFGGWRRGPWYALDGTNPAVQQHLEHVFSTMRKEWGVTYFKLDANFWGAMHGGRLKDAHATRIEAYRRGIEAVLRGAGPDAVILGCNHPIWPSFGLINASRSSNDIKRTWARVSQVARQNLLRNWQNGKMWWNDSDAVVLTGDLTDDEYQFHATAIYASGGLVLSGDDLTKITPARLAMLKKLLPPAGQAAQFDDESLRVGRITRDKDKGKGQTIAVFNWEDAAQDASVKLPPGRLKLRDFWSDADLGEHTGTLKLDRMPPHSARLIVATPIE
jgi:alpha-galactosidase